MLVNGSDGAYRWFSSAWRSWRSWRLTRSRRCFFRKGRNLGSTFAGIAFLFLLVAALVAVHVPLGDYMYRVYTSPRDLKVEKAIYRVVGVNPKAGQTWRGYAGSVLAFSAVGILVLFFFELSQDKLPLHLHDPATKMTPSLAWNTAVSFVTNKIGRAHV